MSSGCKISNKDLHREMFRYLSTTASKPSLARVTAHVMDTIECDEDDPNYKEFKDKIKSFYKYDFGADSIDEIKEQQLVNSIKSIYGQRPNKSEVVSAIKKAYYNDFDEESISEFYNNYFPRTTVPPVGGVRVMPLTIPSPPSSPRARTEIDEDSVILIENAIKKRSATGLDFVTTDEIKLYLKANEIPYSLTKQYTKEELINKIVKFKEGTLSPRSLRLQSTRSAGDDVKDFDVCNTNKYTKDQITEYMKNIGIKLPLKYYTKQKLCQILQEYVGKQPAMKKIRPIIIEDEEEEEIVVKPKKKVIERKYEEEEEEIVIKPKRKISIDELEELEEEAPQIPCGDYENYSEEDEFFACPEDQRCDVDRKKCLPKDYKLEEEFKNKYKAVSLDKNGTPVKFIGSPSKLKSLKQRYADVKTQTQDKKKRQEQERLAEQEREAKREAEQKRLEQEQERFRKEQERLAEQERRRIEEEKQRLQEEQENLRKEQEKLEEEQRKKKKSEEKKRLQEEQERLRKEQERIEQEQKDLEEQKRAEEKRQKEQKLREEQEKEMREAEQRRKEQEEEEKKAQRVEEEVIEEFPEDDLDSLLADLEASNVQQRTFKDIREEIQKGLRKEIPPTVAVSPVVVEAPKKVTSPISSKKLIPRKISGTKPIERKVEEEVVEEEVEIEQPQPSEIEEVPEVDFSEVRQRLRNIMLDPSVSRVLGGQDFLSIPKKISYCVGLSA